jgi:hypothetical protein
MSTAKRRSIEESYSEGERLVLDLGNVLVARANDSPPVRLVVRLDEIRAWVARRKAELDRKRYGGDGRQFLETPEKISSILLRACGLQTTKKRYSREQFRVVANFVVEEAATWDDLERWYLKPDVLVPF